MADNKSTNGGEMKLREIGNISKKGDILLLKISKTENTYYEIGFFIKKNSMVFHNRHIDLKCVQDNNFYLRRGNEVLGKCIIKT